MYKKKPFFIVFEGVEGCGKSYQSKKLYNNLKKLKIKSILTREPGGTENAEVIRNLILKDYFLKNKKTAGISTGSLVIEATRSSVRYYIILIGIKIKCSVLKRLLAPAWPSRLAGGPGFVPGCLILPQSPRPLCVPSLPLGSSQHSAD